MDFDNIDITTGMLMAILFAHPEETQDTGPITLLFLVFRFESYK